MADKLEQIAGLSSEELQGWWDTLGKFRAELPGERAALLARAKILRMDPGKSGRAAA